MEGGPKSQQDVVWTCICITRFFSYFQFLFSIVYSTYNRQLINRLNISTIPWSKTLRKWESRGIIAESEEELKLKAFPSIANESIWFDVFEIPPDFEEKSLLYPLSPFLLYHSNSIFDSKKVSSLPLVSP